ncbi:hypothetical protein CUTER_09665 [Corynebacterium uterequi]|uniref:Uncharacterized protein n=1 Tax=Corynebacterium uterequi TaxID=1072256 RepID=A0A0G3HEX6_9CORY|nr:hypothetical protein CUTER_09665 [Corynebacterium uterequi]
MTGSSTPRTPAPQPRHFCYSAALGSSHFAARWSGCVGVADAVRLPARCVVGVPQGLADARQAVVWHPFGTEGWGGAAAWPVSLGCRKGRADAGLGVVWHPFGAVAPGCRRAGELGEASCGLSCVVGVPQGACRRWVGRGLAPLRYRGAGWGCDQACRKGAAGSCRRWVGRGLAPLRYRGAGWGCDQACRKGAARGLPASGWASTGTPLEPRGGVGLRPVLCR